MILGWVPHWTNTKFEKVELQSKGDVTNKASSHNPWSQGASPNNPSSYRTIKSNDVHTSTTSCEWQATSQHDMERRWCLPMRWWHVVVTWTRWHMLVTCTRWHVAPYRCANKLLNSQIVKYSNGARYRTMIIGILTTSHILSKYNI